jgi:hypothetical protein
MVFLKAHLHFIVVVGRKFLNFECASDFDVNLNFPVNQLLIVA